MKLIKITFVFLMGFAYLTGSVEVGPNRFQEHSRYHKKIRLHRNYPQAKSQPLTHFVSPEETQLSRVLRVTPAQVIGLNFTAATIADVQDPNVIPPNLNGWVGEQQYVLMSYNIMRSFNKNTGAPDGVLDCDATSFFGGSANDVRIDYDRFDNRWIMSCEGFDASDLSATLVVAVSDGPILSATTQWFIYEFFNAQIIPQIRPSGGSLDYQQLAIDKNAVYITVDTFDSKDNFRGTSLVVLDKSSLATTNGAATVIYGILPSSGFTPPADNFDSNPQYGYLMNASNGGYPSNNTYSQLTLFRILDPATNPSLGAQVTISVPTYTDAANAPYRGNLFGANSFIQSSGCTLMAPHVRNKQLFVCHCTQVNKLGVGTPTGDRVGVRWYQFDLTGDATGRARGSEVETTVPALVQWGTLYDTNQTTTSPKFYYIPSIMTNKNGDLVIGCTASGAQDAPNVVYAGRKASDPVGTLRSPVALTGSTYSYNFGPFNDPSNANIGQRWGDLSSMVPDPSNDLDIWSTQEFAAVQNGWGVQVTQLKPA